MYNIYTVYNLCVTRALRKQTLDYKNLRRVIRYRISDFGVERSHPEAKRKPNKPLFNRESSYIIRSIQKMSRKFIRIAIGQSWKIKNLKEVKNFRKSEGNTKYKYWTRLNRFKMFWWNSYKINSSWDGLFCNFRNRESYKIRPYKTSIENLGSIVVPAYYVFLEIQNRTK